MMNTRKRTSQDKRIPSKRLRRDDTTKSSDAWQSSQIVAKLETVLLRHGQAADAAAMKKYMRDKFEFFGVKSPRRRELCKEVVGGKDKELQNSEVRQFVLILWGKPHRELQYNAVEFLERHKKKLCSDVKEFDENMEFFKKLILTKSWWDTVDMLAYKLVGYLVQTHPKKGTAVMEDWVESEDMWLRRTAILHQLGSKANTNTDLLFQFCLARCHEEEFFIRKAIGWALREHAKTQPSKVKQFLRKYKKSLSKLSYNEASKHLDMINEPCQ